MKRIMRKSSDGFTLVELIVTIAILGILGSVAVPSLTGYIRSADKVGIINECRHCVTAGQTLLTEAYATQAIVTAQEILDLSDMPGQVTDFEEEDSILIHLTYTRDGSTVVYCARYASCPHHNELFNFFEGTSGDSENQGTVPTDPENPGTSDNPSQGSEGSDDPSSPQGPGNTSSLFYLFGDPALAVSTLGDIFEYDFGEYGALIPHGSVFTYNNGYYITRNSQYLRSDSDLDGYMAEYSICINIEAPVTPSSNTKPGDVKMVDGQAYVFFPYNRYQDDYLDANYWQLLVLA